MTSHDSCTCESKGKIGWDHITLPTAGRKNKRSRKRSVERKHLNKSHHVTQNCVRKAIGAGAKSIFAASRRAEAALLVITQRRREIACRLSYGRGKHGRSPQLRIDAERSLRI